MLLESIRICRNEPQNLRWHEHRLNESRKKLLGSTLAPLRLSGLIDTSGLDPAVVYKARLLVKMEVEKVEFVPYQKKSVRSLQLVEAADLRYDHKFADRAPIDLLVAAKGEADDILITSKGRVTDTSYANVCFWDGTGWLTPANPLLPGTKRALLLEKGLIRTREICTSDLAFFEKVSLINSMLDPGEVELPVRHIIY